jgi:ADP-ribose pyrophosphatase YjhB (NUDIX family)
VIEPLKANWKWRTGPDGQPEGVPNVTTSGFAIDPEGFFPIIYRGPHVRSAKDCWSLPSGLHECGYTLPQQLAIELKEELGLDADWNRAVPLGFYENLAQVDNWHWVIAVYAIPVKTLDTLINREPEKHPEMRKVHYTEVLDDSFLKLRWAPQLGPFLRRESQSIRNKLVGLL